MRDPRLALFIAIYWFTGGYTCLALTPYALQIGLVGHIIGLVLLTWFYAVEDRGDKVPPILGYLLFALPLTMVVIGLIAWGMRWVGLL